MFYFLVVIDPKLLLLDAMENQYQWRIQDFPQGGAPTPKIPIILHIFAENCMKMKEFGPPGGGGTSLAPPLDPPMNMSKYQAAKNSSGD